MQTYLTPKDVAARLRISVEAARMEMRKMPHKCIGKNGQILRVAEADFEVFMKPDPPLPMLGRKGRKTVRASDAPPRVIPYRRKEVPTNEVR
jgi:hypothetical protein